MDITSTRQAARTSGLKVLVHGPAGSGKTRLCASTGDLEHTLIISAEAGLLSLREYDIDVVQITGLEQLRQVYTWLATDSDAKRYAWVCLDSISEIAEVCLAEEKEANADARKAYGGMADTMNVLIRRFRDLDCNVYVSAKQERTADEGRLLYAPSMPGRKLGPALPYYFDEVFALRTHRDDDGSVRRALQTQNDGQYEAKDRSGALELYEAPSLEDIAAKIHAAPGTPSVVDGANTSSTP